MRSRDSELDARWGTICTLTSMVASDGKKYRTNAATMEGIFRIIQSVTSPKVEPLKAWLAKVGSERIEETIDPEKAIDRAFATYLKKGYDEDWINQRLLTIRVRKELTDEWQKRGVQEGKEFAILTDEITKAWAGMSTRQYKALKGLKKENLRDNMSTTELVLNMLAETSTKDISAAVHPALRTLLKISAHRNRPRFIVSALSVCRNASAWSALVQSSSVSVDFDRTWYSVFILPDTKTETKPYFANV